MQVRVLHSLITRQTSTLVMIAILFFVEYGGLFAAFRPFLEKIFSPAQMVATLLVQKISEPVTEVFGTLDKAERIRDLEEKYALSLVTIAQLKGYERENEQLRALLDQPNVPKQSRVISHPILSLAYPAIEGGKLDQIEQGSVVTVQGVIIGIVAGLSDHQAEIALLTQPKASPILVSVNDTIQAVTKGDGRRLLVTHIPKDATLKEGDMVYTLGQPGVSPRLLVGTVLYIQNEPQSPTQTAVIQQPVSFYDTTIVEVWQ